MTMCIEMYQGEEVIREVVWFIRERKIRIYLLLEANELTSGKRKNRAKKQEEKKSD